MFLSLLSSLRTSDADEDYVGVLATAIGWGMDHDGSSGMTPKLQVGPTLQTDLLGAYSICILYISYYEHMKRLEVIGTSCPFTYAF